MSSKRNNDDTTTAKVKKQKVSETSEKFGPRNDDKKESSPSKRKFGPRDDDTKSKESMPRDSITPLPLDDTKKYLKLMSWNVAGLRGLLKNKPNIINDIVDTHSPDVFCLQEHKLQTSHLNDFENLLESKGYTGYWTCSDVKKGYSGVAVFIKGVQPKKKTAGAATLTSMWSKKEKNEQKNETNSNLNVIDVKFDLEDKKFSGEGRTITVEFDTFYFIGCYVPNSGQNLERLDYRVDEWDPYMRNYLLELQKKKPIIFAGDLNCGYADIDIHNPTAKHIVKQAGLTPRERSSFGEFFNIGFVDAFRYFYPNAIGQFSYWSQRTFAREVNKGIRLDYFICSNSMAPDHDKEVNNEDLRRQVLNKSFNHPTLYDSYILDTDTIGSSDHCPVVLVLQK